MLFLLWTLFLAVEYYVFWWENLNDDPKTKGKIREDISGVEKTDNDRNKNEKKKISFSINSLHSKIQVYLFLYKTNYFSTYINKVKFVLFMANFVQIWCHFSIFFSICYDYPLYFYWSLLEGLLLPLGLYFKFPLM